ncbi:hypothetical protein AcW1_006468 [Taiwanofungus camphoratus]|nr:hypothetical protein AcV5_009052 [Antrodia cinnamomea]KAI0924323.1 hypothetical protein AcW2_005230 [Antrodia cinnamomea]KAI0940837.1 hypothetical protein AcV7_003108 [Antrodia cinnamomea]KAI0954649.1 hypothetical protein AcW1_006468 [Antrodia cinnamomea]
MSWASFDSVRASGCHGMIWSSCGQDAMQIAYMARFPLGCPSCLPRHADWTSAACLAHTFGMLHNIRYRSACNRTLISGASGSCNSAWHIIPSPDSPESTVTSTSGPTIGSGNLVPQVFLTFTGLALYIRTSSLSTAIANITLSTQNPAISITTQVDSAAGLITVIGLLENETTTLAITFVASNEPTQLDIGSFTITLPNNGMSPSILPTLPVSSTLPTFSPIVTTPTQHKSQSQTGADITAEVLGAVLGVVLGTIGAAGITYYYKKRRQRPADLTTE